MKRSRFKIWGLMICGTGALAVAACGQWVDRAVKGELLQNLGQTSITVFPTYVRSGGKGSYDPNAASEIGTFFRSDGLAEVTFSDREVPITGQWRMNQSRMFQESAHAFAAYVRDNPIGTRYALLAEYLIADSGMVGGVHCYIVTSDGTPAFGIGLNSHHKRFAEAAPRTTADCTTVVIRALRESLKPVPRA